MNHNVKRRIVIIGAGIAGQVAALEALSHGGCEVTLVAKAGLLDSNTRWAQGGIAVVTDPADSPSSHIVDTLAAGAGLSDPAAAQALCIEGPAAVEQLIDWGVEFDRHHGELARGLEAAHSHQRILHAGGDRTGAVIAEALTARVRSSAITVLENTMAVDLVLDKNRVTGVALLDGRVLDADAVVLATGGAGRLYAHTTNPDTATGDGLAMALRAGAVAADLEFYQFHPTALAAPGNFLISEAVRGEGAMLLDRDGNRFMTEIDPAAELAPRDVVARAIARQMAHQNGEPVQLDATGLGAEFLARRFPTLTHTVGQFGWDWSRTPIPVAPAAHYFMGGVWTDTAARTSVPGLYAVGEVAATGLHGANRLASNSLLEGAVFGTRVVQTIASDWSQQSSPVGLQEWWPQPLWTDPGINAESHGWAAPIIVDASDGPDQVSLPDISQLMWETAGLLRDADSLRFATDSLSAWRSPEAVDVKSAEERNLLVIARAVVASAAARMESRGAHWRSDHPETIAAPATHSTVLLAAQEPSPWQ